MLFSLITQANFFVVMIALMIIFFLLGFLFGSLRNRQAKEKNAKTKSATDPDGLPPLEESFGKDDREAYYREQNQTQVPYLYLNQNLDSNQHQGMSYSLNSNFNQTLNPDPNQTPNQNPAQKPNQNTAQNQTQHTAQNQGQNINQNQGQIQTHIRSQRQPGSTYRSYNNFW